MEFCNEGLFVPQDATGGKGHQLSRDEAERVIGKMVLECYLDVELAYNPYSTNAYLKLGTMANRLLEGGPFGHRSLVGVCNLKDH